MLRVCSCVLAVAVSCGWAQIGYPGGYPGRYPSQGPSIPWPRKGKSSKNKDAAAEALHTSRGVLRKIDAKGITIDAADGREIEFRRTEKTRFYRDANEIKDSDLKAGDEISVEASQTDDGYLIAQNVRFEKAGAPQAAAQRPAAEEQPAAKEVPTTTDAPPPEKDPNRPVLHRGKPARRVQTDADDDSGEADAPAVQQAKAQPPAQLAKLSPPPEPAADPVIQKARAAANSFSEGLPNYVCTEYMTRYYSDARPADWHPIDVVSTNVVYEGEKESYRDIKVNGKAVKKSIEEIGGSWSTGEYGSVLRGLFARGTEAEFHQRTETTIAGVRAVVYNFGVEQDRSDWRIMAPSQAIRPAYKGAVWIDPATGRVLRIEMQARKLPEEFPLDTVESAIDYDSVNIGSSRFLLPVHAEILSCQRGTPNCTRNTMDFRNYHRFGSESSISFEEPGKK